MERVGERLRLERESRDTSIEALASASGIGQSYLEALERGEIDALPGPAFGKLYIRAYAEVLGFDPQPWIDDYDRERRLLQGADSPPTPSAAPGPRPVAEALARWKESLSADKPEAVAEAVQPITPPTDDATAEPAVDAAVEPVVELESEAAMAPAPGPAAEVGATLPAFRGVVDERPPRSPRIGRLVPTLVILAIVAVVSWVCVGNRPQVETAAPPPAHEPRPVESAPPAPPPPARDEPAAKPSPKRAPAAERPSAPGSLSVPEFVTGRRVVATRVEGEGTEFSEGEAVVFQTRVLGGSRGETIRHVWIYDGRVQQSISLRLGGPDWRTYSRKTLYRRGPWTVEARDRDGRVLAQAAFTCAPASR